MIDTVDRRILEQLQVNARTSNADIARELDMAPSAIHQRLRKLEERGAIQGYAARVEPQAVGRGLLAFVQLHTDEALGSPSVALALADLPDVLEVHDVAGEACYLLKVRVADTDALHRLLREDIAGLPRVRSTNTLIVLKSFKETTTLPLADAEAGR